MKQEKETRETLLRVAKKEFLEKGYQGASLRSICKQAGVTTGALYFFFKDKEDLFANIVEPPLIDLYKMMTEHYAGEMELEEEALFAAASDSEEDIDTSVQIVRYLYRYYDEFLLLLTKSQGSRFETMLDQYVSMTESHYRKLADKMVKVTGQKKLDDYVIHWISHMQIDMFIHLVAHEKNAKKAENYVRETTKYLIAGWYGMFQ